MIYFVILCWNVRQRPDAGTVEISLNIKTSAFGEIYWNNIKVSVNCEWNEINVCVIV